MSVNHRLVNPLTDQLFDGILTLKTREECYEFFEDLCTINELRDMSQRLEVARMLEAGDKYDRIEEATGASTATISRVKRCSPGWEKTCRRRLTDDFRDMGIPSMDQICRWMLSDDDRLPVSFGFSKRKNYHATTPTFS